MFTNDQSKWTSTSFGCFTRSTAFIVDFTWEVNCTQLHNKYRPITTVQYRRILYGHVVGIVRCDWPFTLGYNNIESWYLMFKHNIQVYLMYVLHECIMPYHTVNSNALSIHNTFMKRYGKRNYSFPFVLLFEPLLLKYCYRVLFILYIFILYLYRCCRCQYLLFNDRL